VSHFLIFYLAVFDYIYIISYMIADYVSL